MRINQILTESEQEQLQDLYEGPKFNKFGKAVGDVAGMAAKGIGAVAGGIAGAGSAIKKGFQSGKARVAQGGDSPDAVIDPQKRTRAKAAPMGGGAPAAGGAPVDDPTAAGSTAPGGGTTAPAGKKPGFIAGMKQGLSGKKTKPAAPGTASAGATPAAGAAPANQLGSAPAAGAAPATAGDINAAGPKGTAPAKTQTGAAAAAMKKTADATAGVGADKAGQTLYAQVKSQVGQLDKKGKQRIMQLLQKSLTQPAPAAAKPANTMANAPVSKTNTAKPGNPNAAPAPNAAGVPGDDATPTSAEQGAADARVAASGGSPAEVAKQKADREKRVASRTPRKQAPTPSQAEIDADREAKMGVTSDSVIRSHNSLAETLLIAIAKEKSRMVAEGKISIFKAQ
jgi:hypothetical protein